MTAAATPGNRLAPLPRLLQAPDSRNLTPTALVDFVQSAAQGGFGGVVLSDPYGFKTEDLGMRTPAVGPDTKPREPATTKPSDTLRAARDAARGRLQAFVLVDDEESLRAALAVQPDGISIAPGAATHGRLLEAAASYVAEMVVDVTFCLRAELDETMQRLVGSPCLFMISNTGADLEPMWSSLSRLAHLRRRWPRVGFQCLASDVVAAMAAATLGAEIIQVASDRLGPPEDKPGIAGPSNDPRTLVSALSTLVAVDGPSTVAGSPDTWDVLDRKRLAMVAAREILPGEVIEPEMIAFRAPYRGLSPRLVDVVVGTRAVYLIRPGEPITFGNVIP